MKIFTADDFNEVRTWIYRNARPLETALWQYYFEDGDQKPVQDCLVLYQNEDGGFGHAVEPDLWNPNSSPYATLWAVHILEKIGFTGRLHPVSSAILQYFESGAHYGDSGWDFSIPTNADFPHAPWWRYDSEGNQLQNIGLSAEICAYLIRVCEEDSPLWNKAVLQVARLMEKLNTDEPLGEMGINGFVLLLGSLRQTEYDGYFDLEKIREQLSLRIRNSIEYDCSKWSGYTVRPSKYIRTKSNRFYEENREIIEKEMDYLLETRNPGGVWEISWSWFDNKALYPKEFAVSENWWKASLAIENLLLLREFDRT